tara:strand:+ start:1306 stop:2211 length:906 start_codon:yes stop_codon:yes gene_type:complete
MIKTLVWQCNVPGPTSEHISIECSTKNVKEFASKVGADYLYTQDIYVNAKQYQFARPETYEKLRLLWDDNFLKYDYVLYVDTDVMFTEKADNEIFKLPIKHLAMRKLEHGKNRSKRRDVSKNYNKEKASLLLEDKAAPTNKVKSIEYFYERGIDLDQIAAFMGIGNGDEVWKIYQDLLKKKKAASISGIKEHFSVYGLSPTDTNIQWYNTGVMLWTRAGIEAARECFMPLSKHKVSRTFTLASDETYTNAMIMLNPNFICEELPTVWHYSRKNGPPPDEIKCIHYLGNTRNWITSENAYGS